MCSKKVRLADLKVAELKQELEERELETNGKKAELQKRLLEALVQEGVDPETFLFEVSGGDLSSVMHKLEENAKNLEDKLHENSKNLEDKLHENSKSLKEELCGAVNQLGERMGTVDAEIDEIKETICKLKSQVNTAQVIKTVNKNAMLDMSLNSDIHEFKVSAEPGKLSLKPPQFDGKTPWANYRRQFEAAAKANGWNAGERAIALTLALRGEATNILQTLTAQEQEDYDQLIKHLELRYDQAHLEHVYHSQLKNRCQKSGESLQEFEADIARLVRLAYPATPENVMERLAVTH